MENKHLFSLHILGPVFCLLPRVSSGYAQPITGQVTEPALWLAEHSLRLLWARDRKWVQVGCWWPGNARNGDISHVHLIIQEYSGFSTTRVNSEVLHSSSLRFSSSAISTIKKWFKMQIKYFFFKSRKCHVIADLLADIGYSFLIIIDVLKIIDGPKQ